MSQHLSQNQAKSLGTKVIWGAFWTVGMRWFSRLSGLASMVVIARLLTPEDFGVVAVTTAIVGLMESFTDLGIDIALIKHPDPKRQHYDTAWTFSIIVHTFSAALIALAGFFSIKIYGDSRYEWILYMMSLSIFIGGFSNIGFTQYRRDLLYHKDFQINVSTQLIGISASLILAFWLRSYWALVFGVLTRSSIRVLLSYLMHPYRPRLSLSARQEMFNFSLWIMVRSVAIFLTNRADRLILGAFFQPALLGLYAISSELASMAVFEFLHPLGRALLPALASKQKDTGWVEKNIKQIFNITATIAVACGIGLAAISEQALTLIYGYQYTDAAPMLFTLAIINAIGGFNQPVGQLLLLKNKAREFALFFLLEGIATIIVTFSLSYYHYTLQEIIYARLAITTLAFLRLLYLLHLFKTIGVLTVIAAWIRPILAGAAMFACLYYFQAEFHYIEPKILLPFSISLGAMIYSITLIILWYLMRKPDGIESAIFSRLRKRS